jgi:chemotaxis protein methyltransferase CheR
MRRDLRSEARALIETRIGFVVPAHYDERIDAALHRAAQALDLADPAAALPRLESLPLSSPVWQHVIAAVTVGETNFFRHAKWFAQIEHQILAPLIEARRGGSHRLDIWSAGCASGEETFTLAMLVDRLIPERRDWQIRILGTDINEASLARARQAIYGQWTLREVEPTTLARHFTAIAANRFELKPPIREMASFETLNLAADGFPDRTRGIAGFDLILCRNVLMYLSANSRSTTVARLLACLAPDGWLAVSPAEAVAEWFRPLKPINFPGAIFFRNKAEVSASDPAKPTAPCSITFGGAQRMAKKRRRPHLAVSDALPVAVFRRDPLGEARSLADCGGLIEARRRCEAILAVDHNAETNLLLATIAMEMGDLAPALDAARRAAYLAPDSAAAHFLVGAILFRYGSTEAALRSMGVVLRLLEAKPAEAAVAVHFDATVGALRAAAERYLAGRQTLVDAN